MSSQSRAKTIKHFQRNQEIHPIILCLLKDTKFSKLGFNGMWTENFQVFKLDLEKGRGNRDQIASIYWIIEKAREFQKNIYFCCIDYTKAFDCVNHNELWKILKRWEYKTTWPAFWEICMQVKKQQLEPDMKQWTGSKLGKEYIKAIYYHPAYLTYMQSTSREMLGWMTHKLEWRLLGEIAITSDMQMIAPLWQKVKRN